MLKNSLVFIHLISMAVAVAKVLEYDLRFLRQLHLAPSPAMLQSLQQTKQLASWCLALLWASGLALVLLGALESPNYLQNEKLWCKFIVVSLLTLNGLLMHHFAFPLLQSGRPFLALPARHSFALTLAANISSVSWLYAAFLGIARSWNHQASLAFALGVYAGVVFAAVTAGTLLMTWFRWRFSMPTSATAANDPNAWLSTRIGSRCG